MKYKLFFLLLLSRLLNADYGLADLVLIATSPEEALKVASLIPADQIKPATKNKIKAAFKLGSMAEAEAKINDQRSKISSGGATGGMSPAQFQEIKDIAQAKGLVLPTINSKAEAKAELTKFFAKDQVGGQLLEEVYGTSSPQATIVNALTAAQAA